jgi:signal transduction histidine kinase
MLAVAAMFATTSVVVENSGITYAVDAAISLVAVALWGVSVGILMGTVATICLWLLKPANTKTWKKSWTQLLFNVSMVILCVTIAGWVLLLLQPWLAAKLIAGRWLAWLVAAVVYSESNLWLLIGILRLQHGSTFQPWHFWREERWATPIDVLILCVGGGLLAFAVERFDWLGIVIFFLPVLLSAYAFRIYVAQMQAHMDNLEQIVAQRTHDLEASKDALAQNVTQLARQKEELLTLNQQKDAFLSVLTHDMITPLTNIQLCTEILKGGKDGAADAIDVIPVLRHNQRFLFDIVQNILDLEKLESTGSLPLSKTICELAEQVEEAVEVMQVAAKSKSIRLTCQLHKRPIWIEADLSKVERVLLNLISNAIKYTQEEGEILVQASCNGNLALLQVEDTGYGIPATELPHIFERFRRVNKHTYKATGTGLGLAITKALVELHGGTIQVASIEGQGTCFTVTLPLADAVLMDPACDA